MSEVLLEIVKLGKRYPGVQACKDISFSVHPGECIGLIGENGAGKSTLMSVLSGIIPYGDFEGEFFLKGKPCTFRNINQAMDMGISIIHQELNLVDELSIGENIFLNREPKNFFGMVDFPTIMQESHKLLEYVGLDIPADTPVGSLTVGHKQMVEIAKAIGRENKLLILDEPTSSLTESEVLMLYKILDKLREDGITCIFISHKLREVLRLCSRVVVMKDGLLVANQTTQGVTRADLISLMVGREISKIYPPKNEHPPGRERMPTLELKNCTVVDPVSESAIVDAVSFAAYPGEILGFAGLIGAGRTEAMLAMLGAFPTTYVTKEVYISGESVAIRTIADALQLGIGYITEDRKKNGLNLGESVLNNTLLCCFDRYARAGIINQEATREVAQKYRDIMKTKTSSLDTLVGTLSGGNQQKVLIAKSLATEPNIIIFDEPTRGVDVGARIEIYQLMRDLANQGKTIVMISSDMLEVIGMSDRIIVMSEGVITGELSGHGVTEEEILKLAIEKGEEV